MIVLKQEENMPKQGSIGWRFYCREPACLLLPVMRPCLVTPDDTLILPKNIWQAGSYRAKQEKMLQIPHTVAHYDRFLLWRYETAQGLAAL